MKILLLIIFFLVMPGCGSATQPTDLVAGIKSYSSPEEVQKLVKVGSKQWKILEDNKTPPNDKRPPFHRLIISVDSFMDRGDRGEARFYFFNGRLSSILFYPSNPEQYKAAIEKSRNISLKLGVEVNLPNHMKVRLDKDHTGRLYVAFEDAVLEGELRDWIARYS